MWEEAKNLRTALELLIERESCYAGLARLNESTSDLIKQNATIIVDWTGLRCINVSPRVVHSSTTNYVKFNNELLEFLVHRDKP